MGAVLLLQGELGFLHIFIGGGGRYADEALRQVIHYFEVPDWGAMLGTSWRYFRSLPWLPIVPALAFFVTILGFNMFGYGLQRFIEKGRFHPSGWSLLRFFAVVALVLWGARSLLASSSLEAQFAKMARQFDTQRAWNDIAYLTQPELEGRPSGPGGGFQAAGYIAHQFEEAGLTPTIDGTHFQQYRSSETEISIPPALEVLSADGAPQLRFTVGDGLSFNPTEAFSAERAFEGELVILANASGPSDVPMTLRGQDKIWVMLQRSERVPMSSYAYYLGNFPFAALLRLVPDGQLAPDSLPTVPPESSSIDPFPNLLIGETAARKALAEVGLELEELLTAAEGGEQIVLPTGLRVRLEAGLVHEEIDAVNVVGYFPAADMTTQGDRILVATGYTGQPPQDGTIYPGADEDASAVAIMLEVIRLWRDLGFEPKRTVVFAALDEGGASYLINHPIIPSHTEDTWTVLTLRGLGAGEPELARQEVGSGLARAFDQSARRFGVRTTQIAPEEWFLFSLDTQICHRLPEGACSGMVVTRPGDELSGTPNDTLDHLDPQLLSEAGQAVANYLMVLANR
jgi:hypothetical protein